MYVLSPDEAQRVRKSFDLRPDDPCLGAVFKCALVDAILRYSDRLDDILEEYVRGDQICHEARADCIAAYTRIYAPEPLVEDVPTEISLGLLGCRRILHPEYKNVWTDVPNGEDGLPDLSVRAAWVILRPAPMRW